MLEIYQALQKEKKVIILTHVHPDMDAIGSQFGLKQLLIDNIPGISVLTSGEKNNYPFPYELDHLQEEDFQDACVVVVDTGNIERVSDQRVLNQKKVYKIDHHIDTAPFGTLFHVDTNHIATCSILASFAKEQGLMVSKETATWLYLGLVTDSGRFLYDKVDQQTFEVAAFLISRGIDLNESYSLLYQTTEKSKRLQGYVLNNFVLEDGIAYIKFPKSFSESHEQDFSELKSGTINLMSNIEGVVVWATFTEYHDKIYVELRGSIPVVDVAIKHGGGGHAKACGTAVSTWHEVDTIIKELKEWVK